MASEISSRAAGRPAPSPHARTGKIVIAGGFGVGKTTMVGSISEIAPLSTEELITAPGADADGLAGIEGKTTTTVAMDFGRITFDSDVVIYLFGTPGQNRFWFMWDDLSRGALGAVVLVDTRRLDVSFAAVDYFEHRGIPFIVAVNCFEGVQHEAVEEISAALDLPPGTPVLLCDARQRGSTRRVLLALLEHVMDVVA
ncbi:ATP/GTP-binding protein [Streptomyces sp. DSM 44917]|uniref:ATP/GTP-binding protein n=1 Tax=Streptomyces boetiae TaxID=3075541 RepID=A0ABU2L3D9_9ACTN|nr:ATP/GTP-binding protein [Streptomyces sp. DSM 44917]MDT0306080.1 ATP/GTP-binding protein [Streptomyces sp. DSM 44917]